MGPDRSTHEVKEKSGVGKILSLIFLHQTKEDSDPRISRIRIRAKMKTDPDLDPHQKTTDAQHCLLQLLDLQHTFALLNFTNSCSVNFAYRYGMIFCVSILARIEL